MSRHSSNKSETEFLPAALEIQETPPSPTGRSITWIIIIFFLVAWIWAWFGRVDIVAVAQGRIIPSGHSKVVQPLTLGTVTAIHVEEGQAVKAGEVLIELDPSTTQADVTRLQHELATAEREAARLTALSGWVSNAEIPSTQTDDMSDPLLHSQWREYQDRITVLERERDRKEAEQQSAKSQLDKLMDLLPIVTRRANDQKGLAEKKLLPEQSWLETEQSRLDVYHDHKTQLARINELTVAKEELKARIQSTRSEFSRQTLEQLEEAKKRTAVTAQELIKAQAHANAQTIVAPVDGVVQQLAVHSIGSVVTSAQQLMVIVPRNQNLEVEAMLENRDIGFVEAGQIAEIKIEAFPFTKYGTIDGEIVNLSDDAVADEQRGLIYKMRVRMADNSIAVNGRQVTLSPGMQVTVESKTGSRRLIEYFLSPLLRYRDESVRER
ncbi:MAG: HlyD family type I secretion periplasmic adaptor subunit [Candidatus Sedimenticola sp. (ex Thyasira tokunagai)]